MPIYEYRCAACDRTFEALQRVADPPLDVCRHCGGAASRMVSSPAIQFVGSGWYVTDYARKDAKQKKNGAEDSGKKSGKKKDVAAASKAGGGASEAKSAAAAS